MRQGRGSRATEYTAHKCELSVMLARLSPGRLPVIKLPTPLANTIAIAPPNLCISTGFHQQIDAMQPANSGLFFSACVLATTNTWVPCILPTSGQSILSIYVEISQLCNIPAWTFIIVLQSIMIAPGFESSLVTVLSPCHCEVQCCNS